MKHIRHLFLHTALSISTLITPAAQLLSVQDTMLNQIKHAHTVLDALPTKDRSKQCIVYDMDGVFIHHTTGEDHANPHMVALYKKAQKLGFQQHIITARAKTPQDLLIAYDALRKAGLDSFHLTLHQKPAIQDSQAFYIADLSTIKPIENNEYGAAKLEARKKIIQSGKKIVMTIGDTPEYDFLIPDTNTDNQATIGFPIILPYVYDYEPKDMPEVWKKPSITQEFYNEIVPYADHYCTTPDPALAYYASRPPLLTRTLSYVRKHHKPIATTIGVTLCVAALSNSDALHSIAHKCMKQASQSQTWFPLP